MGALIIDEQDFKTLLVIPSYPDEFFDLREFIICLISLAVVGLKLLHLYSVLNEFLKNLMES